MSGRLVVVGTPIGNLDDLSPRGRDVLATADLVCCEDTRRTGRLLQATGIGRRELRVVNEHTEHAEADRIVGLVAGGATVALVSDAGMPAVSDPGQLLVAAVAAAGHTIEVVPGPTAAVSALAGSGLAARRWCFEGFLPRKGRDRTDRLSEIAAETRTVVLYEAPHRLERTVADLVEVCGGARRVTFARELTKMYESWWRGTLAEAVDHLLDDPPRGEFVVVLEGATPAPPAEFTDAELVAAIEVELDGGASRRDAIDAVAAATGVARKRVYRLATS